MKWPHIRSACLLRAIIFYKDKGRSCYCLSVLTDAGMTTKSDRGVHNSVHVSIQINDRIYIQVFEAARLFSLLTEILWYKCLFFQQTILYCRNATRESGHITDHSLQYFVSARPFTRVQVRLRKSQATFCLCLCFFHLKQLLLEKEYYNAADRISIEWINV